MLTCSDRKPSHFEAETLAASDEVLLDGNLLPEGLSAVTEEKEDSLRLELSGVDAEKSGGI